jgi:hypothetical protein
LRGRADDRKQTRRAATIATVAPRFQLDRRRLLCVVALVILAAVAFGNDGNGLSLRSVTRDGESVYRFEARSSIGAIASWLVAVATLVWTSRFPRITARRDAPPAGLLLRLAAMFIDLMLYISVAAAPIAFLALVFEAQRTGVFVWQISRAEPAPTDALLFTATVLAMVAILILYALPLWRGQQSFGDAVVGIAIVSKDPPTLGEAIGRTMLAYIGVSFALFTVPAALHRPDRRIWPDGRFGIRAVRSSSRSER